jgi:hypothetical protein
MQPTRSTTVHEAKPPRTGRRIGQELGADSYKVKPVDFRSLVQIAERIRERWLESGKQRP